MTASILVTGAGGLLGQAVCNNLAQLGYSVYALGRSARPAGLASTAVTWICGDAGDPETMFSACEAKSAVIHLASTASPALADSNPREDFLNGPALSMTVLDACRQQSVDRFIFASSGGTIYGHAAKVPTSEGEPLHPKGIYGIGKSVTEQYMAAFERLYGLKCFSLRISNIFGPGQRTAGGQGVIAYALAAALSGQPFTIFGDGENIRDFIYVSDAAVAFAACLAYSGTERVFNVGSGIGVSINAIVDLIDECMSAGKIRRIYQPSRAVDVPISLLDITRIGQELGWKPEVDIRQGIRMTVEALKKR